MKQIKEIIRLHEEGSLSERGIARALKMSRISVRKYLLKAKVFGLTFREIKDMSNDQVEQLLYPTEKTRGKYKILSEYFPSFIKRLKERGMTLQILWDEYKEEHPDGLMYSRFCYHYHNWRKSLDVNMHQDHKAGDKMFIDFTGEHLKMIDPITGAEKEVEVFVAILGASQLTYVEAVESQKKHDWIKCNQNALFYFCGVPSAIVPDNLKSGVSRACKYDPNINPEYLDFSIHFKTAILAARPYKSRDKSLVENMVGIVYTRIFVPLRKQVFYSLEDLNEAIRIELEKHNNKKFQKLPYSRRELFNEIEKHVLKPLPAERFVIKKYAHPKVQFNYHVELREDVHYYSVPHQYSGKKTTMIYTDTIVEIYLKNMRIAMHKREVKIFYKGELDHETGRNIIRSETMDVMEFIVRRIQHILSPYFQKVRFMGIYSNKYRGQHKEHIKELKTDSKGIPRKDWDTSWRRLIWKIYDEDPLLCQNCGAEMRIKKVYTDYDAEKESKNLIHLRYYIRGRWRIERRKKCLGPITGRERRKIA